MLCFTGIGFGHSEGGVYQKIVKDFSADFPRGSMTALTGPSGCGKTTLLSICSLLVRPDSGSITLGDSALLQLGVMERAVFRRRSIALVFQTSRLIKTCSVREQLLMTEKIRGVQCFDKGLELLERFKLAGKSNQKPSSLSGGEKQRVALAQALMFNPDIVLADEPTAGLDEVSSAIVSETLKEYAVQQNAVVLVATHDIPVMNLSHYVRNVRECAKLAS